MIYFTEKKNKSAVIQQQHIRERYIAGESEQASKALLIKT
jgi:hypothetical protein